jgi:transposase
MALNGILYVLTSGCRWCDMPAEYCSYKTAWRRLRRWVYGTVHSRPWPLLRDYSKVSVDSTTVEAKKGER